MRPLEKVDISWLPVAMKYPENGKKSQIPLVFTFIYFKMDILCDI